MKKLIDAAFSRKRTVLLMFAFLLISGIYSYRSIPKESQPDITIPIVYVSMRHEGIAPKDAERLLLKPMEKELKTIEGLKEIRAEARQGFASVTLEFDAGFDADKAMVDVRESVDKAKSELPPDTDEPVVKEINVALFPVLAVSLSGAMSERALLTIAKRLRDKLEGLGGVLEVKISGEREEQLEVIVKPQVLESYHISLNDILTVLRRNNRLVAAGALDTGTGRQPIKVPGVIDSMGDVTTLPVRVIGKKVVTFGQVATVKRGFKEALEMARVDGKRALVLEVTKRLGANIIQVTKEVRQAINSSKAMWPKGLQVHYLQDQSSHIKSMLSELQNNIMAAIILVMIVVVAFLGNRPAILVGLAIPGSFLSGILVIYALGYTLNMVVLFSLILVVGMLVDGAIVTTELAIRKINHGVDNNLAFNEASKRMAWPIISSTLTTLAVFFPLLFWPGIVGEFMKYLPVTVIITLTASIFMALIFIPVLGSVLSIKKQSIEGEDVSAEQLLKLPGFKGRYLRFLHPLLKRPRQTLLIAICFLIVTYFAYGFWGVGVEFFPDVEPDFVQVQVYARGDKSVKEKDEIVKRVEKRLLNMHSVKSVYARTIGVFQGQKELAEDIIGVIQLDFVDWRLRPSARRLMKDIEGRVGNIPGIKVQVIKERKGPRQGKPVQVELISNNHQHLTAAADTVVALMKRLGGFKDIDDTRSLPGIEWQLNVNHQEAARFGADVQSLGDAVSLVTNGLKLSEYQPDDADKELDIRLRLPTYLRHFRQLKSLRVGTQYGQVPVSHFISFKMAPKTSAIQHRETKRAVVVNADVESGVLVSHQVAKLMGALAKANIGKDVMVKLKGETEDQNEASAFLSKAFIMAVFLMTIILLTQFNRFNQTFIVLSAIIFSTAGVLLGLLLTHNAFGIVMCGIGVISLAGIVVNNNIVLIDTYNRARKSGLAPIAAILSTCEKRVRPVLLTSITTVLGLMPMVFSLSIDIIGQDIAVGAPSTEWWVQLSTAIAGGLTFATVLTLVLTPCMLMLGTAKKIKKNSS